MRRDSTTSELRQALAFRGHLHDAYEVLSSSDWHADLRNWFAQQLFGELAEFNVVPADTVDAVINEWWDAGWGPGVGHAVRWWAARRDTISLSRYVRLGESLVELPLQVPAADIGFINWVIDVARAHLTLARGDTAVALQQLELIRQWPSVIYIHNLRVTRAQLLAATGRDAEAAEILDQLSQLESAPSPLDVIWVLERARVNERLGNHDKAIRDYSYVMDVWRSADALLQPFVEEARAAVGRLAGEPRG